MQRVMVGVRTSDWNPRIIKRFVAQIAVQMDTLMFSVQQLKQNGKDLKNVRLKKINEGSSKHFYFARANHRTT